MRSLVTRGDPAVPSFRRQPNGYAPAVPLNTPEPSPARPGGSLILPADGNGPTTPGTDGLARDGPPASAWADVPWRSMVAAIALLAAALVLAVIVYRASNIVILTAIAGFLAIVLARPVAWLQTRAHFRHSVAIAAVLLSVLTMVAGLLALFILPVRSQLVASLTDLPGTVQQAAQGRGPVGHVVQRLRLEQLVRDHQRALTDAAKSVQDSMPTYAAAALRGALAVLTVTAMTALTLAQSTALAETVARALPIRHRERVRAVARDAARSVSGYMIGNLLISLCAGVAAFTVLTGFGVANALVLAIWVAFADLIPLVGATLGAVVAVAAAFLTSSTVGVITLVFFVVYQQFENSVLQTMVMARTVKVNPLGVLLSVVLGAELFGAVGALLSVPLAGALSVVVKELWRQRPVADRDLVVIGGDDETVEPRRRTWTDRLRFR